MYINLDFSQRKEHMCMHTNWFLLGDSDGNYNPIILRISTDNPSIQPLDTPFPDGTLSTTQSSDSENRPHFLALFLHVWLRMRNGF